MGGTTFKRLKDRKGVVAVMAAIITTALLGFTACAVDIGMVITSRNQLQNAADSAALAAASKLDEVSYATAISMAKEYASYNKVLNQTVALQDSDIQIFDNADKALRRVKVTAYRTSSRGNPINLLCARVFGYNSVDMTASSKAGLIPVNGTNGIRPWAVRDKCLETGGGDGNQNQNQNGNQNQNQNQNNNSNQNSNENANQNANENENGNANENQNGNENNDENSNQNENGNDDQNQNNNGNSNWNGNQNNNGNGNQNNNNNQNQNCNSNQNNNQNGNQNNNGGQGGGGGCMYYNNDFWDLIFSTAFATGGGNNNNQNQNNNQNNGGDSNGYCNQNGNGNGGGNSNQNGNQNTNGDDNSNQNQNDNSNENNNGNSNWNGNQNNNQNSNNNGNNNQNGNQDNSGNQNQNTNGDDNSNQNQNNNQNNNQNDNENDNWNQNGNSNQNNNGNWNGNGNQNGNDDGNNNQNENGDGNATPCINYEYPAVGELVTLKFGSHDEREEPYWFAPICMPPVNKGNPQTGADVYRDLIMYGYNGMVEIGDVIRVEPGNMTGPTEQGVNYLISQDSSAYWDINTNQVMGSSYQDNQSPRIIKIVFYDPNIGVVGNPGEITVTRIGAFFLEGATGPPESNVTGRFIETVSSGELDMNSQSRVFGVGLTE